MVNRLRNISFFALLLTVLVTWPTLAEEYSEGDGEESEMACEQAFRIAFCSGEGCTQAKANSNCSSKKCDAVCKAAKCKGGSASLSANACDGTNPSCGLGTHCSAGHCGCGGPEEIK